MFNSFLQTRWRKTLFFFISFFFSSPSQLGEEKYLSEKGGKEKDPSPASKKRRSSTRTYMQEGIRSTHFAYTYTLVCASPPSHRPTKKKGQLLCILYSNSFPFSSFFFGNTNSFCDRRLVRLHTKTRQSLFQKDSSPTK